MLAAVLQIYVECGGFVFAIFTAIFYHLVLIWSKVSKNGLVASRRG